ncbi:MAG: hypothetical protein LWW93_09820 [Hyphomicrobiales bacterium]|nr:hypothetical protein [Hyphomicrobiales bacterium]
MTEANAELPPLRPPPWWRRHDLAPLGWVGVGLLLLVVELVGMWLIPPAPDERGRAVWAIGSAFLHAASILLGTLMVATLPRRHHAVRRIVSRLSVAIFGLATLASHGWALWVIFARLHAPDEIGLRFDPMVNVVGGLYIAFGWLAFLALLTLAAWIGRAIGGPGDR